MSKVTLSFVGFFLVVIEKRKFCCRNLDKMQFSACHKISAFFIFIFQISDVMFYLD